MINTGLAYSSDEIAIAAGDHELSKVARMRILHVLTYYPRISHTMLAIGIGTAIPSTVWKPVLSNLVREGLVDIERVSVESFSGRTQLISIISLAPAHE